MKIKTQIEEIMNSYNAAKGKTFEKVKAWQDDKIYSDTVKREKIQQIVKEAEQNDQLTNAQIKKAIQEAKKEIIGVPKEKPADYQVQVSNALKFLELAGDNLTDDQAYGILKPFQGDYETMDLFQGVVHKLSQGHGISKTFDKTFTKTNNYFQLMKSFEIVEGTMNNLFDFKDHSLGNAIKLNMFLGGVADIETLANKIAQ